LLTVIPTCEGYDAASNDCLSASSALMRMRSRLPLTAASERKDVIDEFTRPLAGATNCAKIGGRVGSATR
jgi:hypothetical protein